MMFYLAAPILVLILFSFNDIAGERNVPEWKGFTLHWWQDMFGQQDLNQSMKVSLLIAPTVAFVAAILGALIGLALGRYRFKGRGFTEFLLFIAIAVPEIVLASGLANMFLSVAPFNQIPKGFWTIWFSHIGFCIAFVAVTVRARVSGLDRSMEDAAQDLYATPLVTFFRVTLPLIFPGIVAGFILAFVLSLDDFVITNFVAYQSKTYPIWVYGATRIGIPPQVNVFGTIMFSFGVILAVVNALLQRRTKTD
jgi:spermidine/putrescine transport system permease protein